MFVIKKGITQKKNVLFLKIFNNNYFNSNFFTHRV